MKLLFKVISRLFFRQTKKFQNEFYFFLGNTRSLKEVVLGLPKDPAMVLVLIFVGLPMACYFTYGLHVYGVINIDDILHYYFPTDVKVESTIPKVESTLPKVVTPDNGPTIKKSLMMSAVLSVVLILDAVRDAYLNK